MINFQNIKNNTDIFRKGEKNGMPYTEEPTYLTFSLEFVQDYNMNPSTGLYPSPLLYVESDDKSGMGACTFLKNRSLVPQAARLAKFNSHLVEISNNAPWFFQNIKGVDKLWKSQHNMSTGYQAKDLVLEITTLESLDLKMTYLADLYRKSIYETFYMRELVPENLRWFNMHVYVAEFRSISSLLFNLSESTIDPKASAIDNASALVEANKNYFTKNATFMKFNCHMCEFDFEKSLPGGAEYSVFGFDTPAANTFNINVGLVLEQHSYSFYDTLTATSMSTMATNEGDIKREDVLKPVAILTNNIRR